MTPTLLTAQQPSSSSSSSIAATSFTTTTTATSDPVSTMVSSNTSEPSHPPSTSTVPLTPVTGTTTTGQRKPVRIWVDGCYDVMHHGHFNALRQAKAMGDIVVAGVHSDAELMLHKGPTVMNENERYRSHPPTIAIAHHSFSLRLSFSPTTC